MPNAPTSIQIYKASAGSGKTFTLAVEYIALLAINPMAYQNILAVTFTNKATAEMKQRILSTLYGIAHSIPSAEGYVDNIINSVRRISGTPSMAHEAGQPIREMDRTTLRQRAKEALSNIIHDYSRFHIETIDSFFQSILHEIANELDLPTNIKVELDETQVLSEAVDKIIDELNENSTEFRSIIAFIEEKIRNNRPWKVDETVKDFGRNILKENYLIHGEEVRRKITNISTISNYRNEIKSFSEAKRQPIIDLAQQMLSICDDIDFLANDGAKTLTTFLQKVAEYKVSEPTNSHTGTFSDSIAEYQSNADKWFKKSSKKKDVLIPTVEDSLMPMLRQLFDLHDDYVSHLHTTNAICKHIYSLMLLNKISETVRQQNNDANRFLLAETANFLNSVINDQDIPFIYEKTGTVIKHIMIDEFQDTSTLQWKNFRPLIMNSIAAGGSCLIVGDVKQSIYRFRNSDWRILNNIEKDSELKDEISNIPAKYNYRSSRNVVEFNNTLFQNAVNILTDECPDLITAYGDVAQIAKKEQCTGFVRVENIISPELDEAMMERIQHAISDLIASGVQPNDITILVRTNREIPAISDYFNEHKDIIDTKVVSDDAFRLDVSPAITIIISALRALAEQGAAIHLATLAYNYRKYVTLPQDPDAQQTLTLSDLATDEDSDSTLPPLFNKQGRRRLQHKSLPEQVEEIYNIFRLNSIEGQDAYMFCFHDMLQTFCNDQQATIDNFLEKWDEKLHETTIPNGTSDGIRIMTMHKSKGLEFHSVIIPSCSWDIKPNGNEVMWCTPASAPYDKMPLLPISVNSATPDSIFSADREVEELKTLVDNINVLYVAFTRAKHNLIILTGAKEEAESDPDGSKPIPSAIDSAQSFLLLSMPSCMKESSPDEMSTRWEHGDIVPTSTQSSEMTANIMDAPHIPCPVHFVSHPSVAEFRQSYESDLFITSNSDDITLHKHAEKIRLISLGNLYHAIFQLIRTAEDIPHAISLLESRGCFTSLLDAEQAQRQVTGLIDSIASTHPEWFSPEWTVLNERAILYRTDFASGGNISDTMLTKRPDRVIVRGKQAIVIDYKTALGVVRHKADGTITVPPENINQVQHYMSLLADLGYTDIKGFLWYILDNDIYAV